MMIFAFCQDAAEARERRAKVLEPHMAHLRGLRDLIGLAAPLATADGAALAGDERLTASLFALRTETVAGAKALMCADPYFADGVWRRIDFYTAGPLAGPWSRPRPHAEAPPRDFHALLLHGAGEGGDGADELLLQTPLRHAGAAGEKGAAEAFDQLRLMRLADLAAARRQAEAAGAVSARVFAVPVASGQLAGFTRV